MGCSASVAKETGDSSQPSTLVIQVEGGGALYQHKGLSGEEEVIFVQENYREGALAVTPCSENESRDYYFSRVT